MKKLVVMEIKVFFLLFFSYINKNFSCDCCDECWEIFFPDKKPSSKYSDKNKKLDIPSIIDEEKEEGEKGVEENEEENEGEKEGEENKKEEERKKNEEEENKKEEEENKVYLESLLKDFDNNVRRLSRIFLRDKQDIYEKCRLLGRGASGVVCKIKKKNKEKFFALKWIVVKDNNGLKEIQKEIQNMIRLRNEKKIVKIFDVYKLKANSKVTFYIIMEFCENGNLDKAIENKQIKKEKDELAYQIINAVHSCYKKKIVHRDLKPQNIFLDKDWNVKLGDFGISDNFEYDGEDSSRVGSLRYMCYEIIQDLAHNPFKADLYSLGVLLYELYTGISYSEGEDENFIYKNGNIIGYKDNFYTNENVELKLNKNLADEKYKNLKILLTGLLQQFEKYRWDWENIFDSEFYKELDKKYKEKVIYLNV